MRDTDPAERNDSYGGPGPSGPDPIRVLVGTRRSWYAAALRTVLEPEGFALEVTWDLEALARVAAEWSPQLILLDHEVGTTRTVDICRSLREEILPWSVAILVTAVEPLAEQEELRLFAAGAWVVLHEPLFFGALVEQLRRLAELAYTGAPGGRGPSRRSVRLRPIHEAWRSFRRVASLAERRGEALTCVVAGPTNLGRGERLERQREVAAELCSNNLRASDACAWSDSADVVILAYGASEEGAVALVERLNRVPGARTDLRSEDPALSAGIRLLLPSRSAQPAGTSPGVDGVRGEGLAAARAALRAAREAGGGIRIARGR